MPDAGAASVIAKIEANFRNNTIVTTSVVPGGEVKEGNGVITFYTGDPAPIANGVIFTRINPADLDETIRQVQDCFRSKNVPMFWWVFPSDEPANLVSELERHGFVKAAETPGMAVSLEEVSAVMPVIPGLEIVKCEDLETMLKLAKVMTEVEGIPEFMQKPFAERLLKILETLPGQQLDFVALLDGRPVGTSMVNFYPDGVAGIYGVTILEDVRRRGIGRALTLHALIEARKSGCNLGILLSSEMGYRMYESLGFKEYCKFRFYFWQPEEQ